MDLQGRLLVRERLTTNTQGKYLITSGDAIALCVWLRRRMVPWLCGIVAASLVFLLLFLLLLLW
jgi:hypothetical protein